MLRLRYLFSRKRLSAELREEMDAHIEERAANYLASGESDEEARRKASRRFGNATLLRENSVAIWQFRWLEALFADVRFALRQLIKSPVYTLMAVLVLAVGIGANTAIFGVMNAAILRSLPIAQPSTLVSLGFDSPQLTRPLNAQFWTVLEALQNDRRAFSGISGWRTNMVTVDDGLGALHSVEAYLVTGNALQVMGVRPYLGRLLIPADDQPGGPVGGWPVVLDYGYWKSHFHADRAVLGQTIELSGHKVVIVGVLPPDFHGLYVGSPIPFYLPLHFLSVLANIKANDPFADPQHFMLLSLARLAPGMTLRRLNVQLKAMSPTLLPAELSQSTLAQSLWKHAYLHAEPAGHGFSIIATEYEKPLLLMQGIVFVVLLLCCLNLAGLQMARMKARRHEFAVRAALGSGRARILRLCMIESLLLALTGGVLAAALAWSGLRLIAGFLTPPGDGQPLDLHPDVHLLWTTFALALVVTLLIGSFPALVAGRIAPISVLRGQGVQGRRRGILSRIWVPLQFAIAMALVFTAMLFTHTLASLRNNLAGIKPAQVTEVCAQFQSLKEPPAQVFALYHSIVEDLRTRPGILSAAYTWVTPFTGFAPRMNLHSLATPQSSHSVDYNVVSGGYFRTMGTPILAGREFTQADIEAGPQPSVCIVNQAAARLFFPGQNAIGNALVANRESGAEQGGTQFSGECRVVGVVANVRYSSLRAPAPPTLYLPVTLATIQAGNVNLVFMIRSQSLNEAKDAYRKALAVYAPTTGYMTFLPLAVQVDQAIGSERLIAGLCNAFAAFALLLSGVGLFGILALGVEQQRSEIGVRMALGSSRAGIFKLVLREAIKMLLMGMVLGAILMAATSSMIRHFLYDTSPVDIPALAVALLILITVALLAALVPAGRAAKVDPIEVLRNP